VTIYLSPEHRALGAGPIAFINFAMMLFDELALYKIYIDIHEYNVAVLNIARRAGLSAEGQFKGNRVLNGRRYDTFRFALYRERAEYLMKRFAISDRSERTFEGAYS